MFENQKKKDYLEIEFTAC